MSPGYYQQPGPFASPAGSSKLATSVRSAPSTGEESDSATRTASGEAKRTGKPISGKEGAGKACCPAGPLSSADPWTTER